MLVQIVRGTVSISRQVTCTSICVITLQEQVMKNALHVVDAIFLRQLKGLPPMCKVNVKQTHCSRTDVHVTSNLVNLKFERVQK